MAKLLPSLMAGAAFVLAGCSTVSQETASSAAPAQASAQSVFGKSTLPGPSDEFQPGTTAWGDPDFRGTWPLNDFAELPVNRPEQYGDRFFKTNEEIASEQGRVEALEEAYNSEDEEGTLGLGHWIEYKAGSVRTSMIATPENGRLPAFTKEGIRRAALMRSSWVTGQTFDWVDDFDTWDRCITRGFPASMFPFRYNNGVRIFQSPGYVVIALEMLGTRVIPVSGIDEPWPDAVTGWFGNSRGRWIDHNTLEIETTNIQPGASALNIATRGVPADNTTPMSDQVIVTERLSLVGSDTITYEMNYQDPIIWEAPFTLQVDWSRDDDYTFYEYACHAGNVQVRNYITASRAQLEAEFAKGRITDPLGEDIAPLPAMDPASRGVGNSE